MNRNYELGSKPVNFFEISEGLLPSLPWFPCTDKVVTEVAEVIAKSHFVVKYDKSTSSLIDAAVMRNPDLEEDTLHAILQMLREDEYIILYNSENHPPVLAELFGEKADYVELFTYEDCVEWAEHQLNDLLRFDRFDYRRYLLYVGAAFAIVRADHPNWIYETFIECFRKDVADRMAERSEDYMGYREFENHK